MRLFGLLKRVAPAILALQIVLGSALPVFASEAPYYSFTLDKYYNFVRTKDGYLPSYVIDKFGEETLKKPSDIYIDSTGRMYIADTFGKRVLVCNQDGTPELVIKEGLSGPTGIFVTNDGFIYVADPKVKKVLMYSSKGELIREYGHPESPLFGTGNKYAPTKLAVDTAGNLYILSEGNGNGIVNLSKHGDFFGYFGANATSMGIMSRIQRWLFTEGQLSQLQRSAPAMASGIDIDKRGLIYTVTQGSNGGISKFNIAGLNVLEGVLYSFDGLLIDIAVGDIENIFAVSSDGWIYEFTREGDMLFAFGGTDDGRNRIGLFTTVSAIDIGPDGRLYVLDSEQGRITVFDKTEYASTVHMAQDLYQQGKYVESREPWEEVLRQNSLFDYAHKGIGESYYKLEMYDEALEAFYLGGGYRGYSNAFWELRNTWIQRYSLWILAAIILLILLVRIKKLLAERTVLFVPLKRVAQKVRSVKLIEEIGFAGYFPKNPADAFYGVKYENKVSVFSSTIMYILFFIVFVINKYFTGFLFKTVREGRYELGSDFVTVFGVCALIVVSNNMICSIRDGEGSLKDIYCSFAYCLMPYIFLKPFGIILSNILSYNEEFLLRIFDFIIFAGIGVLVVVMIKEIQAYTFGETVKCILLTIFTGIMLLATLAIIAALVGQIWDFVTSVGREVYFRAKS